MTLLQPSRGSACVSAEAFCGSRPRRRFNSHKLGPCIARLPGYLSGLRTAVIMPASIQGYQPWSRSCMHRGMSKTIPITSRQGWHKLLTHSGASCELACFVFERYRPLFLRPLPSVDTSAWSSESQRRFVWHLRGPDGQGQCAWICTLARCCAPGEGPR